MNEKMLALKRSVINELKKQRDPVSYEALFKNCVSSKQGQSISSNDFRKFLAETMKNEVQSNGSCGDENSEPKFSLRPFVQRNSSSASTQSRRSKRNGSVASCKLSDEIKHKFETPGDGRRNLLISLRKATNGREMTANWSDVRHHYKKNTGRNLTTEELNRITCTLGKSKADLLANELSDILQPMDSHGQVVRLSVSPTQQLHPIGSSPSSPAVHSPPFMSTAHMNSSNLNHSQAMDADLSPIPIMNSTLDERASAHEDSIVPVDQLDKRQQEVINHLAKIGIEIPRPLDEKPTDDMNVSFDERNGSDHKNGWEEGLSEELCENVSQAFSINIGPHGDCTLPVFQNNPVIVVNDVEAPVLSVTDTETSNENREAANDNENSLFTTTEEVAVISIISTNSDNNTKISEESCEKMNSEIHAQTPVNLSGSEETTTKYFRSPRSNAQKLSEFALTFTKAPEPPSEDKCANDQYQVQENFIDNEEVSRAQFEVHALNEEAIKNKRELRNLKKRLTQQLEIKTVQLAQENFSNLQAAHTSATSGINETTEERHLTKTLNIEKDSKNECNFTESETRTSVVNMVSTMSILLSQSSEARIESGTHGDASQVTHFPNTQEQSLQNATSTETIITIIENKEVVPEEFNLPSESTQDTPSLVESDVMVRETRDFLNEVTNVQTKVLESKVDEVLDDVCLDTLSRNAELPEMELVLNGEATLPKANEVSKKGRKSKKNKRLGEESPLVVAHRRHGRLFNCCTVL